MLTVKKMLFALCMLALFIAAGCGGNGDTEAIEDAEFEITIGGYNWHFDQETYTIPADTDVAIHYVNEQGHHGIGIRGTSMNIRGNGSAVVNLEPGEYTIFCNISCGVGHSDMAATLIVE